MKYLLLFTFIFSFTITTAQKAKAFQFYNEKGKKVSFTKLTKKLAKYDVVLIGEHHNNSINHWLQLRITKALYAKKEAKLTLGAEMFERDNQQALNSYLKGNIAAKNLKDSMRLWNNFKTDYKPLVDFAKNNQLEFIATNIPRRYAAIVAKKSLDSLNSVSPEEKKYMMQLPVEVTLETPGYPEMIEMMGDHAGSRAMNFVAAQAVKDATMAESIAKNLQENYLFVHYNGDYHSKQHGGIYWYLKKLKPNLKIAVIQLFEAEDEKLSLPTENYIPTEFNLVLPKDMIKTY
ncbi:putative iron-regulated protein [Mesonia hippocampi]|uniref:Putative iron-regulated protein n=1 Tax=Mesonia hippocampi TaxID=1628250 RepID=A0A840EQF7_9FLAO|nr:ChaN family lipoprotein [Mesonia hippocampi]MBB4118833.1 putative iron-regulated protein [Mesonia hippocampi]